MINKKLVFLIILLILGITFLTKYQGSTDVGDYANTARYFSGNFAAKLRVSHSILYGFMFSSFVEFFNNFIIFKIASIFFLFLLIYSVYFTTKNEKAFWLMILSPIVWYMSPWINPIQLSSLLFFWGYYFIKKFDENDKPKYLLYSGLLVGFSWIFWDAMIFFVMFIFISFLYNKKLYHSSFYLLFIIVGLLPKLIADQMFFGFAFSGIMRYFFGLIAGVFYKGIYGNMGSENLLFRIFLILVFLPLFTYKIFSKEIIKKNRKFIAFLIMSILLLIKNTQIRYTLILFPIIIYEIVPLLNPKQFKKQIIFSIVLILIISVPYIIQIKYSTNAEEFSSFIKNINKISLSENQEDLIKEDLIKITEEFPNSVFIVGNDPDYYQKLAVLYWGNNVKEFVSIEDYNLYLENKSIIFEKKFMPIPKIEERRQIWISGGINKNENDKVDYKNISLAIGDTESLNTFNFTIKKRYNILILFNKYGK